MENVFDKMRYTRELGLRVLKPDRRFQTVKVSETLSLLIYSKLPCGRLYRINYWNVAKLSSPPLFGE